MNSSVWAVLAAQGSEEKNQFEYFLARAIYPRGIKRQ
jgi:hypothetical protein